MWERTIESLRNSRLIQFGVMGKLKCTLLSLLGNSCQYFYLTENQILLNSFYASHHLLIQHQYVSKNACKNKRLLSHNYRCPVVSFSYSSWNHRLKCIGKLMIDK